MNISAMSVAAAHFSTRKFGNARGSARRAARPPGWLPRCSSAGVQCFATQVRHSLSACDARMIRIYHRRGWSPEVLGSIGEGRDKISVGLWHARDEDRQRIAARAGIAPDQADRWFEHSPAAQRIEMPTPA